MPKGIEEFDGEGGQQGDCDKRELVVVGKRLVVNSIKSYLDQGMKHVSKDVETNLGEIMKIQRDITGNSRAIYNIFGARKKPWG